MRTTKLDAINLILAAAGEAPVNTYTAPTTLSATQALRLLEVTHKEVLSQGWHWNTEYEVSLEVDLLTGRIPVPQSVLRLGVPDAPWIVHRGEFIYDRNRHTNVFEDAVSCTIIRYLDWEELPEEARSLIYAMAAVRYYSNFKGQDGNLLMLRQQAFISEAALRDQEAETGRYSIFDSPDIAAGLPRGNMYVHQSPRQGRSLNDNRTPE